MSKKKEAKIASKNDPRSRGAKALTTLGGKVVEPIMIKTCKEGSYMGVRYKEGGQLVLAGSNPMRWSELSVDKI